MLGTGKHRSRMRPSMTRLGRTALCASLGLTLVAVGTANASAETLTEVASASWTASDQAGWGSAFALRGQTDAFAIQGNTGRVNALQPGKSAAASLAVSAQDVLLQDTVTVPSANPLNLHHTLEARRQSDGSTYRGRVQFYTGGKIVIGVSRTTGTAETGLGSVSIPMTATGGQNVALQFQVSGTNPVQLSVRAFPAGTTAPNWQYITTDSSSSRIQSAGGVGIWDYVSGAGSAATYSHDDFSSYSLNGTPSASTAPVTSAAAPVTSAASTNATIYRSAGFDSWPDGKVVPSNFVSALGGGYTKDSPYDDMRVVQDSRGAGKVLRTTLKAGTIHSKPVADGGDNLFLQLPQPVDSACVSYEIRFDSNFDWSLGGKLPGLEGVAPGVSPSTPTGGTATNQGWSGRAMWLGPRAYSWAGPTNMGVTYMYHPGQAGTYGDNERWGNAFVAGRWHTVKQCYKMNTVGRSDGQLAVWFDGQQVINNTAYVFRTRSEVHITHLIFSIFRGGSTLDWAGSRDSYVDIDNMRITSG